MAKMIDLSGRRFGRLVVRHLEATKNGKHWRWVCDCDCGAVSSVFGYALRNGHTNSCGCLHSERSIEANTKHGRCKDPAYNCWALAKARCHSKGNPKYQSYGGRGIYMCDEWKNDFPAFLRDMGPRPSKRHSIERIDNDGPYSPENCKWATVDEQAKNKRTNLQITYLGKTLTASDWDRELGFSIGTIRQRVAKGWSVEDVITAPKYYRMGRGWR